MCEGLFLSGTGKNGAITESLECGGIGDRELGEFSKDNVTRGRTSREERVQRKGSSKDWKRQQSKTSDKY